jgi:hypothetical protein
MAGKVGWINNGDLIDVKHFILRRNDTEIAIEFNADGNNYLVILNKSASGEYSGSFKRSDGYQGKATAQLLNIKNGYLLFGYWGENNMQFKWFLEVGKED